MRYLDPKNDVVFKKLFGKNKKLLMSLLNDLLMREGNQTIKAIDYLPAEQIPDVIGDKNSAVDVKCEDQAGNIFLVEMQMIWTASFKKRVVFNGSKAYVQQLKKGSDYETLHPVYILSILNQSYIEDTDAFYHQYRIVRNGQINDQDETLPGLEFVFIELPKFLKNPNASPPRLKSIWLKLLAMGEEEYISQELIENPLTKEAVELIEESYFTEYERAAYDHELDKIRKAETIYNDLVRKVKAESLKEGLEEGLRKGQEKGLKEGLKEGEKRGREKGVQEERIKMAKAMLAMDLSVEMIVKATGLSTEAVGLIE